VAALPPLSCSSSNKSFLPRQSGEDLVGLFLLGCADRYGLERLSAFLRQCLFLFLSPQRHPYSPPSRFFQRVEVTGPPAIVRRDFFFFAEGVLLTTPLSSAPRWPRNGPLSFFPLPRWKPSRMPPLVPVFPPDTGGADVNPLRGLRFQQGRSPPFFPRRGIREKPLFFGGRGTAFSLRRRVDLFWGVIRLFPFSFFVNKGWSPLSFFLEDDPTGPSPSLLLSLNKTRRCPRRAQLNETVSLNPWFFQIIAPPPPPPNKPPPPPKPPQHQPPWFFVNGPRSARPCLSPFLSLCEISPSYSFFLRLFVVERPLSWRAKYGEVSLLKV